ATIMDDARDSGLDAIADAPLDVALEGPPDAHCPDPALDQSLLFGFGSGWVDEQQPSAPTGTGGTLGQSVTVGLSGQLVGLEILATQCSDDAVLELDLYDVAARRIATVQRRGSALCDGATSLSPDRVGAGYFDLASECLWVTAGAEYEF